MKLLRRAAKHVGHDQKRLHALIRRVRREAAGESAG